MASETHGGVKRSRQLAQHIGCSPLTYRPLSFSDNLALHIRNPFVSLYLLFFCIPRLIYEGVKIKSALYFYYRIIELMVPVFNSRRDNVIHIEISDGIPLLFGRTLMYMGFKKVISYPHNIEALTNKEKDNYFSDTFQKFSFECSIYRMSTKIFVISGLDKYLLQLVGINSTVLSYYPSTSEQTNLLNIKELRIKRKTYDHFLILGSCGNAPTLKGMSALIDIIQDLRLPHKFIVAGNQTQLLRKKTDLNIAILGSVSSDILATLYSNAKALIINQIPTSGFLTRIIEAQIIGIPVIVNKSYYQSLEVQNHINVFIIDFDDPSALSSVLKTLN